MKILDANDNQQNVNYYLKDYKSIQSVPEINATNSQQKNLTPISNTFNTELYTLIKKYNEPYKSISSDVKKEINYNKEDKENYQSTIIKKSKFIKKVE